MRPRAGGVPSTILGVVFLAIMIFPVYWMINVSLQTNASAVNTALFPVHPSFAGYAVAIRDQLPNLLTSLEVSLISVVFTLVIATPAAYALAAFQLRWMRSVLIALLIAQMVPGIIIANALYTGYNSVGLLNNVFGLALADASNCIPFAVLIIRAFMVGIPASLVEAARVDGAGHLRAFVSVVVPISRNSIITAALFGFLFSWSDFIFALTLTTSNAVKPITLGIYSYIGGYIQDWSPVMATAVLSSVPAILLLIFAQRYIAAGALGGAIK